MKTTTSQKVNKSQLFSVAWNIYRSKSVSFATALKMAWSDAKEGFKKMISSLKYFLLDYTCIRDRYKRAMRGQLVHEFESLLGRVALGKGFAAEVAQTCEKYNKISEKQAYWIARYAVENGMYNG